MPGEGKTSTTANPVLTKGADACYSYRDCYASTSPRQRAKDRQRAAS